MKRFARTLAALFLPRAAFGSLVVSKQYDHPGGCDRLLLRMAEGTLYWRLMMRQGHRAGEFHSVVWEKYAGGRWRTRARITRRHLDWAGRYWATHVHSIDPASGVAIIKVAHMGPLRPARLDELPAQTLEDMKKAGFAPEGVRVAEAIYEWVSWDMRKNRKVAVLRSGIDPFDKFE